MTGSLARTPPSLLRHQSSGLCPSTKSGGCPPTASAATSMTVPAAVDWLKTVCCLNQTGASHVLLYLNGVGYVLLYQTGAGHVLL